MVFSKSPKEKTPVAKRLGNGCNEWRVTERIADIDQAFASRLRVELGVADRECEVRARRAGICGSEVLA